MTEVRKWTTPKTFSKIMRQMSSKHNTYTRRAEILGKSYESVQCAMLKACDACADMGQL